MNRAKAKRMRHGPGYTDAVGTEPSKRRVSLRMVMLVGLIVAVAGGIVGLSVAVPDKTAALVVGTPGSGQRIPSLANNSGILNPKDYQYDPLTDRYWHPQPGNAHWHPGQPPAHAGTATFGTPPIITSGSTTPDPDIPNPTPWQYDPGTNKHWYADHSHWHDGPVPANR